MKFVTKQYSTSHKAEKALKFFPFINSVLALSSLLKDGSKTKSDIVHLLAFQEYKAKKENDFSKEGRQSKDCILSYGYSRGRIQSVGAA